MRGRSYVAFVFSAGDSDRRLARGDRRDAGAFARLFHRQAGRARSRRRGPEPRRPSLTSSAAWKSAAFASSVSRAWSRAAHDEHAAFADRRTRLRHHAEPNRRRKARGQSRSRPRCCSKARCAPASRSSSPKATSPCWVRSARARKSSPADRSMSTARCAAGRWRASTAIRRARIYCQKIEAELLAIDGYYQTAEEIDAVACAIGRLRPGCKATP